ncbi:hypothetical protein VNI00_003869 [Paramarasmius palmivorus]|uniref:Ornithine decarboxylase antizyme n=1 Tax=Paramarasmius palmivorus TaxID=297713 RepID=A0AAW0DPA1_9AGAR
MRNVPHVAWDSGKSEGPSTATRLLIRASLAFAHPSLSQPPAYFALTLARIRLSSWQIMSQKNISNLPNSKSSLCPANGRQTVGDGATSFDIPSSNVIAVCQIEGSEDNMYYYSTTFSGGPGVVRFAHSSSFSGAFDIPKVKCPPDRLGGSSECVTGSPASVSSLSYPFPSSPPYSNSPPYAIPNRLPTRSLSTGSDLSTPPLTPDDGSDSPIIRPAQQKDALDFLMTVFPKHGLSALPYAKSVTISAPDVGEFEGMVMELPGRPKTLYVNAKNAASLSLRESIVALLDLADERLECSALVIVLDRSSKMLGEALHSLMYVGGTVVTKPPFEVDPAFVLVGMEV